MDKVICPSRKEKEKVVARTLHEGVCPFIISALLDTTENGKTGCTGGHRKRRGKHNLRGK